MQLKWIGNKRLSENIGETKNQTPGDARTQMDLKVLGLTASNERKAEYKARDKNFDIFKGNF